MKKRAIRTHDPWKPHAPKAELGICLLPEKLFVLVLAWKTGQALELWETKPIPQNFKSLIRENKGQINRAEVLGVWQHPEAPQFFSKQSFILLQLHYFSKWLCTFLGACLPQLHPRLAQHCRIHSCSPEGPSGRQSGLLSWCHFRLGIVLLLYLVLCLCCLCYTFCKSSHGLWYLFCEHAYILW